MNRIAVVFKKEVLDNLRDRRSLTSTVLYALLGPFMILLMIVILGNIFKEETEKPLLLPVSGVEYAPALVQFLEQNNVIIQPAPDDPQTAVRTGDVEVVLIIPEDYGEAFSQGRPARVQLVEDTSRTSAMPSAERARDLLRTYSSQIGGLRLLARGVDPTITSALSLERVDVATPESQSLIFLNMLPYFMVMAVFMGGTAVIIDTTAGERERGSLEPLLINPVRRREFVLGKLLASIPFAMVTIFISLAGFYAIFNYFPVEKFMGMRLSVSFYAIGNIFLLCLPMIFMAAALQMIIASFARSFKEAQTYVNWLPLVPALPGIALAFLPVKPTVWAMLIPTFGQQMLFLQLIRGELTSPLNIAVSTVATLMVAGALIVMAIQLYSREQILFGKK